MSIKYKQNIPCNIYLWIYNIIKMYHLIFICHVLIKLTSYDDDQFSLARMKT